MTSQTEQWILEGRRLRTLLDGVERPKPSPEACPFVHLPNPYERWECQNVKGHDGPHDVR